MRASVRRLCVYPCFVLLCSALLASGCYSPARSQQFFLDASSTDTALEPIYSTALYTVFFDHVLRRCVVHSAYTWGEQGGSGGGAGVGLNAFRCDPGKLRERAVQLGLEPFPPKLLLDTTPEPAVADPETQAVPASPPPISSGRANASQSGGQP